MKNRILFLDAEARSTLSIIRSVGKNYNFDIYVAGRNNNDICRFSKYTKKFLRYSDPLESKKQFLNSLELIVLENEIDFIFPCSDLTLYPICDSYFYNKYSQKLIAPSKESYLITFDKRKMNEIALKSGVLVPKDYKIETVQFPCVIKPRQSRFYVNDTMVHGFREFVNNEQEANIFLDSIKNIDTTPLIQEVIEGEGNGIFIAAKDGEIFSSFAHERIREVPPGGGASTLRKSSKIDKELFDYTKKLISNLKWDGIAMVEFKGKYFMEINGRPWGSMDLAVSSGVDFPSMMIEIFVNNKNIDELKKQFDKSYDTNHHAKWIEGEFEYINYLEKKQKVSLIEKLKILCLPFKNTSYDTFKLTDPLPFLYLLFKKIAKKVLR